MYHSLEAQNKFLAKYVEKQSLVAVYLKNGVKLKGNLVGTSENAVFIRQNQLEAIYKSAINTIIPLSDNG